MHRASAAILLMFTFVGCKPKATAAADTDAGAAKPAASVTAATTASAPATAASAAPSASVAASASAAPSASAAASAKPKSNIPTCKPGQMLGTVAWSPFKPICGNKCKTDADCKGGGVCQGVNQLTPTGESAGDGYPTMCVKDF